VRLFTSAVSPSFFAVLGVQPAYGRRFRDDEVTIGKHRVAILGHRLWVDHFGSNPAIVGQSVQLSGIPHEVVGVLGADFEFPDDTQLWLPLPFGADPPRSSHYLAVFGRLKPGVTLAQARADMDRIGAALEAAHPDANRGHGAYVLPFSDFLRGPIATSLWLLLAAVAFVLLIACVNVANLLLAKAANRRREVAVRSAVGAGRTRIAGQMLTESVVLGLAGGAAGLFVAWWYEASTTERNASRGTPSCSIMRCERMAQICIGASMPLTRYWAAVSSCATATRSRCPVDSAIAR